MRSDFERSHPHGGQELATACEQLPHRFAQRRAAPEGEPEVLQALQRADAAAEVRDVAQRLALNTWGREPT